VTLQPQSGKLHPIKSCYNWKQSWNAFATGITGGGGGGGVQSCIKSALKTRRIQQDLSVFVRLSNAKEQLSQLMSDNNAVIYPRKQDGAFMSSKEGRGRITQEFLFLFKLQAYERMMGPSKLLIGHQCQHNNDDDDDDNKNNLLLHKECLLIFLSSSQLNSSGDLITPVTSQSVFVICLLPPTTHNITFWVGRSWS
jgi:hypothetical protein